MLNVLLLARRRHYVNFVRHHFDRGTLLVLAAIGGLMAFQVWRSPADIGFSLKALTSPGFGERWLHGLLPATPGVFVVLWLLARTAVRRTPELELLRSLPVPDSTLTSWLLVRHLSRTGPVLLVLALPALGGSHLTAGGLLRAGAILAAGLVLDWLAIGVARRERPGGRAAKRRGRRFIRLSIPGTALPALMVRDVSYLLRCRPETLILAAAAAVIEGWIVAAAGRPAEGLLVAGVLHAIHAVFMLSLLDVLFERDAASAALLKSLPLGGARLLRARAALTASLLALPGIAPLVVAIGRGAAPAPWGFFLLLAVAGLPGFCGILYAGVHVALFPRTRVASFLLVAALVLLVLFWFFVPFVTPILAIALLVHWGLRAARSFDRLEIE